MMIPRPLNLPARLANRFGEICLAHGAQAGLRQQPGRYARAVEDVQARQPQQLIARHVFLQTELALENVLVDVLIVGLKGQPAYVCSLMLCSMALEAPSSTALHPLHFLLSSGSSGSSGLERVRAHAQTRMCARAADAAGACLRPRNCLARPAAGWAAMLTPPCASAGNPAWALVAPLSGPSRQRLAKQNGNARASATAGTVQQAAKSHP
eukprot:CAMPEP_0179024606 /NCGR_PEP_ID=MMETSP0796-20121207/7539_1 /TAXON_ID=73915 /ORGANISM="Pyrodinium bahamense, Strain pbaha01" /LENGTH=209 /DNA_ID=CAMNT_0020720567 /DNA_START=164 /DNA_END=796 /DNA_ORIENTATION=+